MPRGTDGNYTLPAGNPVVQETVISSDTHNTTMSDVAQALTDSLDRQGRGGLQAPLKFTDGTVTAPGMGWVNEPNSGFYRSGNGQTTVAILGNTVVRFSQTNKLEVYEGGTWQRAALVNLEQTFAAKQTFTEADIQAGDIDATQLKTAGAPAVAGNVGSNQMINPNTNGLTFRWKANQSYDAVANPGGRILLWPTAFPTACYGVVVSLVNVGGVDDAHHSVQANNFSATGCGVYITDVQTGQLVTSNVYGFSYFAWGY